MSFEKSWVWTTRKNKETKNRGSSDEFSWRDKTWVKKKRFKAKNRGAYRSRRYG